MSEALSKMKSRFAFPLLETANLASGTANGMVMITLPWLVLETTGSATKAGLLAALSAIPGVIVSPIVGGLIDRVGRRAVSIFSDVMSALSVLLFVLVDRVGSLTYAWILVIAVLGAVFDPAGYTARKALITNAAVASDIGQDTANGRHEGIFAVGWMLGPALGAALIASSGAVTSLGITASMFVIAALVVFVMRVDDEHGRIETTHDSFVESLKEGVRVLHADRPLFALTMGFVGMAALYMPIDTVIWPAYFEGKDDPGSLGAVFVALAAGSVLGAFSFGKLAQRFDSYRLLRLVIVTSTCALAPMSLLPPTWIVVLLGFVAGVSWGPFNPLWNSVVQRRIEPHLQGRVYGLQMSVLYAAPPLGQVVVGYSVDQIGVQPTFFVVIGSFLVFAVLLVSVPVLRKL